MKYWRLYNSAEKEVGFMPQIIEPEFEGLYTDANQLCNNYSKKIDSTTIIPKGHLHKRAKLTDLMTASFLSGDLFASSKLQTILNKYSIEGVQFAESEVITKTGEQIKTWILHPYFTNYSFLDLNHCIFQISNAMGDEVFEQLKFESLRDYREKKETLINESKKYEDISFHKFISISKLQFKENTEFDVCSIFDVLYGGVGFYVSQRIADEMLNTKCTGVIFRELNERYP